VSFSRDVLDIALATIRYESANDPVTEPEPETAPSWAEAVMTVMLIHASHPSHLNSTHIPHYCVGCATLGVTGCVTPSIPPNLLKLQRCDGVTAVRQHGE
jgi:hypothetical protein